jgi:hypothetical protein
MKKFKKNKDGFYICEECGRLCKNLCSLGTHISKTHHIKPKQYYDKWIREKGEGYCKECGNETSFDKLGGGYLKFCSTKCLANSSETRQKYKDTCLQKYNVENTYQSPEKIKKIKQTWMKNYGVENPYQAQTVKDKIKQNNLDKYGVEYSWQREDVKNNIKQANMKAYGVEYQQQRPDIHLKTQKHAFGARLYKNTEIYYRGLYELNFLEKYYNIFPDIINGPSIKYIFEGKTRMYFPDFYIPSLNLIVECKNSYLNERDKIRINKKKIATLKNGYKYCIIINRNYDNFNKIVEQ